MQQTQDQDVYYSKIGQLIKSNREKADKTQEQLSNYLGFKSRISIANIESGSQKVHVHTLVAIAKYLAIDITDLLPVEDRKTEVTLSPRFEKLLNKEGINSNSSKELKDLISKIDSLRSNT